MKAVVLMATPCTQSLGGEEMRKRWFLHQGCSINDAVGERTLVFDDEERKVGFIENTARRHRRGGRSEVTVTSEPHT